MERVQRVGGSRDACPVIVRKREQRVLMDRKRRGGGGETLSGNSVNKMRSLSQMVGLRTSTRGGSGEILARSILSCGCGHAWIGTRRQKGSICYCVEIQHGTDLARMSSKSIVASKYINVYFCDPLDYKSH